MIDEPTDREVAEDEPAADEQVGCEPRATGPATRADTTGEEGAEADGTREEIGADRAVLDRVVDGTTAVLLVGPAGDELLLAANQLPADATDGTWLIVDIDIQPPTVVGIDHALTAARSARTSRRLEHIRRTRRGGRFDR